jgi:hypothetical protein
LTTPSLYTTGVQYVAAVVVGAMPILAMHDTATPAAAAVVTSRF